MRHLSVIPLLLVCAWLQNPVPGPRKVGKPQQQKAQTAEQVSGSDQRGTEQTPLVVKTIPPVKTQAEAAQEAKDREEKTSNDRNLVVGTFILAVVGGFQLFVFGYQAVQLRRTVKAAAEQSKTMERSVAEAVRLTKAIESVAKDIAVSSGMAVETVKTMRETAERQLRAYVFPVGAQRIQDKSGNFKVKVIVKNSGQTPAYSCISWCGVGISTFPVAAPFPNESADPGTYSIAPGGEVELGGPMDPLTDALRIAVGNGTHAIYAFGTIQYVDAFKEPRFTNFRMFCMGEALAQGRFMFSKDGNKAT